MSNVRKSGGNFEGILLSKKEENVKISQIKIVHAMHLSKICGGNSFKFYSITNANFPQCLQTSPPIC